MAEDEMAGWHHHFNGHESEQIPGVGDVKGSQHAAVHRDTELDMTEQLNNNQYHYAPDTRNIIMKKNKIPTLSDYLILHSLVL